MTLRSAAVAAVLTLAACASGPGGPQPGQEPVSAVNQPERLLTYARKIKAEQGCAEAAPAFRVIASFGKGYEVAQYELGACLLEAAGDDPEAVLFREEALLWLRRAAWAGNARAQGTLARVLSGAPAAEAYGIAPRPEEALGWAMIYKENAAHELYGLALVDPAVLAHMKSGLHADAIAGAEAFAADFEPVVMAIFTPPPQANADGQPRGAPVRIRERRRLN